MLNIKRAKNIVCEHTWQFTIWSFRSAPPRRKLGDTDVPASSRSQIGRSDGCDGDFVSFVDVADVVVWRVSWAGKIGRGSYVSL